MDIVCDYRIRDRFMDTHWCHYQDSGKDLVEAVFFEADIDVDETGGYEVKKVWFLDGDNNEILVLSEETHEKMMGEVFNVVEHWAADLYDRYHLGEEI